MVGLVSVRVQRVRVSVGTCSVRTGYCQDVFGVVGLMSGRVRRGLFIVVTFSAMSAKCRDVFDEVVLVSGFVSRGLLNVGTCWQGRINVGKITARSA